MANKNAGGSSHNRRNIRRNESDGLPHAAFKQQKDKPLSDLVPPQSWNELFTFVGFALGCASWGWTVISPDSSIWFGSLLLLSAVVVTLCGLRRVWRRKPVLFWFSVCVFLVGFGVFDWHIVVKPQRDKPFRDLLVEGYHLTNECESIPGTELMPTWMRDQSKGWQARVQQLIGERLKSNDAQLWQKSIVIGTLKNAGLNAYQCLWLSTKVSALETITANNFDPSLRHANDVGPVYWLNEENGQVDISGVFKSGGKTPRVYMSGGGSVNNPSGKVIVTGHDLPVKDGTITFTPEAP